MEKNKLRLRERKTVKGKDYAKNIGSKNFTWAGFHIWFYGSYQPKKRNNTSGKFHSIQQAKIC